MSALPMYAVMAAGMAAAAAGVWQWIRSHRMTPEQREQQRRQRLAQVGRICDGTVLDVQEISANGHGPTQLLIYSYDVGGVSYEASQDVTHLRQIVDIESCRLGLPSSVRYDPRNPGNSIVVSEAWTGLRT
ncbi:MAG: DUF3592 domain-containing protein [Terriglobales bacterium]